MRILVLSDIHANLPAFDAVLADAGTVDAVWCLGDVVGYGPDPNECIARIRDLPNLICLLGNHDAAALGRLDLSSFNREARLSAEWMQGQLTVESLSFLSSRPEREVTRFVTLSHGSPRNPVWEYLLDTHTAWLNFDHFDTTFCFVGHTHLPVAYFAQPDDTGVEWRLIKADETVTLKQRAILNPGSVGQPRDHDPRAAYAIFDPDALTWEAHRVSYDIASVQKRIQEAGLPPRHALRLSEGW